MFLEALLQALFFLVMSPLLLGIINKTKAFVGGRKGPPVLQTYYDLEKLFRKEMVFSKTTTWVFRSGPVLGWISVFAASWMVPLGHHPSPLSFEGDMILMTYLLAMGRFFTVTAALDTGSSFEGMGGAREVSFSSFSEPALFLGFLALAKESGSFSLSGMFASSVEGFKSTGAVPFILLAVAWFIVLLAENNRIPFDDPNTHLELTMVHEVMVLDHSGPAMGLVLHASAMKLMLLSALVLNVIFPWTWPEPWVNWVLLVAEMGILAVLIGWIESMMARLKMKHVPNLLVSASLLSAFSLILLLR